MARWRGEDAPARRTAFERGGTGSPVPPRLVAHVDAEYESTLLAHRSTFFVSQRLASRVYQAASAHRSGRLRRRAAALVASAAFDVAVGHALDRTDRFGVAWRLFADVVDVAVWSTPLQRVDAAVLVAVPLATEAGIRWGVGGLAVPAVMAPVCASLRRRGSMPGSERSYRWLVVGAALGAAVRAYARQQHRAIEAQHHQQAQAEQQAAFLAGQGSVALGADSVVDILVRTVPLLGVAGGHARLARTMAEWKHELAERAATRAVFLLDALLQWQADRNRRNVMLRDDVAVRLPEGHGTILLSPLQAQALRRSLDALQLCGDVDVAVDDLATALRSDTERAIRVDRHLVVLPTDPPRHIAPFDCGPLALALGGLWTLEAMGEGHAHTPGRSTVAVAWAAAARWSHHRLRAAGEPARWPVMLAASVLAAVQGVVATRTMRRRRNPEGLQRFPFFQGMPVVAMLMSFYRGSFDRRQRRLLWLGLLASIGFGLASMPEPILLPDLVAEAVWTVSGFLSLVDLGLALAESERGLAATLQAARASDADSAFERGRRSVIDLVTLARDDVVEALRRVADELDPDRSTLIHRRLDEVDDRLQALAS